MIRDLLMPSLSPTMEEGKLTKWLVQEGDAISSGDIIAEIETDKAVMELEAPEDGFLSKILVPEGSEAVKVNGKIAEISSEATKHQKDSRTSSKAKEQVEKSVGKFEMPSTKLDTITVRESIRDAIKEEMSRDDDVFLIGEEVGEYEGAYKISQGLLNTFGPKRVIDTPITEHGFTGLAIGAAFSGLRPIVEYMTFNFAMQAMDQIVNSAAKTLYMSGGQISCPIVFRGPNGAASRVAAQHSQDFSAFYSSIPGLKVIQPFTASDAKGLLKSAIRDNNPVIFLENEILYGKKFEREASEEVIPIGKAKIFLEGTDLTLISFGIGMTYAIEAAELLSKEGISTEIIDLRTIRPLDRNTIISSVKKTNRCITIEEGFPICSVGNNITALIMEEAFDYLDAPVINCAGKDVPMPYAENLEKLALVNTQEVVDRAKEIIYR
tara:strand:- start:501 stop:1811 length:1311 start_codon:yes stop_codon:yes gene_type:complete